MPALVAVLAVTAGCASGGGGAGAGQADPAATGGTPPAPNVPWSIHTREHIDLWLHAFALLGDDDTSKVPLFRRGYKAEIQVLRNRGNVFSQLDANAGTLAARLRGNRNYMSLQFLPIYFDSWEDLRSATQYFAAANGDPNRARDPQVQNVIAFLAGAFPTAADREWLRVFMTSIEDESAKFYHSYWLQEQREREPATRVTDSLWQKVYYPKFRRFLMGSQQSMGRMMLSLPIGGEGRTVGSNPASVGSRSTTVVMTYPENATEALEPIYVLAHELVGTMMNTVVNDNTTPAEKRDGIADRYSAAGLVRGGHILLQRIAPELADGYARYYLRISNSPPGSNPESMLSVAFPLPDSFVSGFRRQLEIVLGGI